MAQRAFDRGSGVGGRTLPAAARRLEHWEHLHAPPLPTASSARRPRKRDGVRRKGVIPSNQWAILLRHGGDYERRRKRKRGTRCTQRKLEQAASVKREETEKRSPVFPPAHSLYARPAPRSLNLLCRTHRSGGGGDGGPTWRKAVPPRLGTGPVHGRSGEIDGVVGERLRAV